MRIFLTILFSLTLFTASAQIVPGQIRQVTIAGTVVLVKAPADTTVWNPCIFYHGGNGVSDSTSLVTEGDSTLPKRLRQGWWNGSQTIPGGYSSPQSGGTRSAADFWVVMIAQQNGWPPSLDDMIGAFLTSHRVDTTFVSFCGWSQGGSNAATYKTKWNLTNDVYVRKVKKEILCAPGFPNVGSWTNWAGAKDRVYFDSTDGVTGANPAYSIHNNVNSNGGNSKIYDVTRNPDGSYTGYGHSGIVNPAFRTAGTSANTNNIIWLISDTAGNAPPRCAGGGVAIPLAYDNIIDLDGGSNFYFDSILYNFKGTPQGAGAAVRNERQVFDLYNDSSYYPSSAKGRHILIAFDRMKLVDSIRAFDSSSVNVNVKAYKFKKITASNTVHSTYDSILNANAYAPNYNWSTVGGAYQYRMLQSDMTDTVMYYLFNFYGAIAMSFTFYGCDLPGGATENLILPVPDTITYSYATIGQLRGSNVTQIGSENFLKDTLKYENEFRFYDYSMYFDTVNSNTPANWKINMAGAGNMDSIAAVKYGLRSYQTTRGGNGYSVNHNYNQTAWELRQTNTITDNPQIIDNYRRIAKLETQFTAKKGRNTNIQYTRDSLNYVGADTTHFGLNINIGREIGNEDDGEWLGQRLAKPQHIFAKLAACFNGDRGRMGSKTGIKTMDSTMEVVYPGTISYRTEWHRASYTWSKLYYGDRNPPWDVDDYHIGTSSKLFTRSPYSFEVVGLKGIYPEYFDDATRNTNIVHLFSRLRGKQAKVYFGEYAVSASYDWPKFDGDGASTLATPLYGSYDNLAAQHNVAWYSAAIQEVRQFLVIAESPVYKAAGYEFHDNSGFKNSSSYRVNDQSNGKYTIAPYPIPDTVALWPKFFVTDGLTERMKDYKFESVIAKAAGGIYVTQWRNTVHTDSIAIITRKSDTTGAALSWSLDVGGATSVLKWVPSFTSLAGTQTPITPVSNLISAPSDLMPTVFFLRETALGATKPRFHYRIKENN